MKRRSRTRRVLKWTLTLTCVLIAGMLITSCHFCSVFYTQPTWRLGLTGGCIEYVSASRLNPLGPCGFTVDEPFVMEWQRFSKWRLALAALTGKPTRVSQRPCHYLPLFIPFIILLFPTVAIWFLDYRWRPPGHCQKCGYNLTGNVSGRCPECGEPT